MLFVDFHIEKQHYRTVTVWC